MKKSASVAAIGLALALACGGAGCSGSGQTASVQSVAMICGIGSTANVERFAGVVEAKTETKIEKDQKFAVAEILVEVGDAVEEGQTLFIYDQDRATLELEKAELELQLEKSTVEEKRANIAQLERERAQVGASAQLGYTLQIQQLEVEITEAEFSIAAKEKELEQQRALLSDLEVKAPVSGSVRSINTTNQTDNYGNPLPFMVITELGSYRVKGYVNEANRLSLYEGMSVLVRSRVDATVQQGTLTVIDVSNPVSGGDMYGYAYDSGTGEDTTISNKYPFYVELAASDGFILGQHVYVEPDYGQGSATTNSLMLPEYYINDADGAAWVWAQGKNGKLERRSLTLGTYDAEWGAYEVLDGLTGEDYIAFPEEGLKAGMVCVEYDGYVGVDPGFEGDVGGEVVDDFKGEIDGDMAVDGDVAVDDGFVVDDGFAVALPEPAASTPAPPVRGGGE